MDRASQRARALASWHLCLSCRVTRTTACLPVLRVPDENPQSVTTGRWVGLALWGARAISSFRLGQAQQDHARCQPQAKSGQVQHDPPLHAVDDVVIFCIHNPTLLFTLLDAEASGRLAPLLHLAITYSDTKPQQKGFRKLGSQSTEDWQTTARQLPPLLCHSDGGSFSVTIESGF